MLDIREIEYWISRYEQEADRLDQCVTLSALYSIRDRLRESGTSQQEAQAWQRSAGTLAAPPEDGDSSEFLRLAAGKDSAAVWAVVDELMDTLRVVRPRAYESVMRKLGRL